MGKVIPNLQLFSLLVLVSFFVLGLDYLKWLSIPKRVTYFITNPMSFSLYRAKQSVATQFHFIFAARFAAKENKALQEQIGQLVSENANLRRNVAEAQAFLEQQKSIDPKTYDLIPARPIGFARYLKIDRGSTDGVKLGQAVVFKDNYIGQVQTVSEGEANVRLLTDPDSKLAAFSYGKEGKAKGLIRGDFGLEMILDKILHEEHIEQGDLVYSEGTEGYLPRGLIVGRVSEVIEKQNEVFKQAKVKPIFDIRDLELVFIIQE